MRRGRSYAVRSTLISLFTQSSSFASLLRADSFFSRPERRPDAYKQHRKSLGQSTEEKCIFFERRFSPSNTLTVPSCHTSRHSQRAQLQISYETERIQSQWIAKGEKDSTQRSLRRELRPSEGPHYLTFLAIHAIPPPSMDPKHAFSHDNQLVLHPPQERKRKGANTKAKRADKTGIETSSLKTQSQPQPKDRTCKPVGS